MPEEMHDFGKADLLEAEALGAPGQRRFRLVVRSRRGSASLWLEKEQLVVLGQAIEQLLAESSQEPLLRTEVQVPPPPQPHAPPDFPANPDVEFQIGQLQIGRDEEHDIVLLRAGPLELVEQDGELVVDQDAEPQLAVIASRVQAERLAAHIATVVAAGRPRCPLCGMPMGPTHVCDKQNGFHPVGLN